MKGIDCAKPLTAETAAKLASAGYGFAARYLVPKGYSKRLTRAEAEAITASGMNIVSVFETTANRPVGGAKNGYIDGAAAYREALAIGQSKGTAIYFAVDYDAQPEDYDAIAAYLQAAAGQIPGYWVGVYGSHSVVEAMIGRSAAQCGWQTYAWSKGKKSQLANIFQHQNGVTVAGHPVDLNESYGGEGWWSLRPAAPKPADRVTVIANGARCPDGEIRDGKTWIELRAVLETIGAVVEWDERTKTVNIRL